MSKEFGLNEGFIVSSDCVGRFGNPQEIEKVWDFAITEEKFLGVEVVAWKKVFRSLDKLVQYPLKVSGLHGRMGRNPSESFLARARSFVLDSNLAGADELLSKSPQGPYILMHSAYLDDPEVKEIVLKKGKEQAVLVENHVHQGALKSALDHAVSLREKGVNAGLMIDIVHYFYENSRKREEYSLYWNGMVKAVEKTIYATRNLDPKFPIGIHIPVGTKENDNLFMDGLEPKHWQKLADVIHDEANIAVILENQQKGDGLLLLTHEASLVQKSLNKRNFETLVKNEVILL